MGKHDSAKKHAKRLARRERVADKQRRRQELARKHEFPAFVFQPNDAPPPFVDAIRRAVKEIDFRDPEVFPAWERTVYLRIKQVGAGPAMYEFRQAPAAVGQAEPLRLAAFYNGLGHRAFGRMPKDFLLKFIPFHDVLFVPEGRHIRVLFRSLKQAKGPGGTVYYSPHEPKLVVGGRQYTVAFSGHAIQRACERLTVRWPAYAALGDVFAFFERCLEFERCELPPETLGFSFFNNCEPGWWDYWFAKQVMGEQFIPNQKYTYRVGYCPAVLEGRFIKATTLLFPGYAGTPEHRRLHTAALPREKRKAMLEQAKGLDAKRVLEPEGVALLKWFHDAGVPQVRQGQARYAVA